MAPLGTSERPNLLDKPAEPVRAASQRPVAGGWPATEPKAAKVGKLPWKKLVSAVVLAAVVAAGYNVYALLASRGPAQDVQLFTVNKRSFPVVLKEKGELKANHSIDIRSELEGRATIIYLIAEGTRVEEGDVLIELASDEIDNSIRDTESKEASALASYEAALKSRDILRDENASKIRKADLQLKLAQMEQERYINGEQKELEQDATLAVEKAQMVLDREQQDFKDAQDLFEQGFITRIDLKDAEFNEYAAGLDLKKAKLALDVLNKYTIPMALEEKKSDVHEAEQELERERKAAEAAEAKATAEVEASKSELDIVRDKLAKLRDQKKKSKILAPAAGLVVYATENRYRSDTTIDTGVQVHERQLLLQLPDTSQMKVEVRVHEAQIERLKVGMPATATIEGFDRRTFPGKVSRIAVMADSQNSWLNPNLREYKTDVLLDGTDLELKPNTTARVEIQAAYLENVLAVPVQAVFAKGGRFYVFVDQGGQVRPVQVKPGLASTDYVEIQSGLTEGQNIRLAITDEMKLLLPDTGDSERGEGEEEESSADDLVDNHRSSKEGKPAEGATQPAGVLAEQSAENASEAAKDASTEGQDRPKPGNRRRGERQGGGEGG